MAVTLEQPIHKEWSDASVPGSFHDDLPKPDINYCYAALRLFSWFPVRNSKGATYFKDDVADDTVANFIGRQVNLIHDKQNFVVGNVKRAAKNDYGLDVIVEIDREQAAAHGLDPEDLEKGNVSSWGSVETTWYGTDSPYLLLDPNDSGTIVKELPGTTDGIQRSTADNGYRYGGKYIVAQRLKPVNFTGVGLVPNPADITAHVYAMAADATTPDRKLNQDAASVKESKNMFTEEDKKGLEAQIAVLKSEIASAKADLAAAQTTISGLKVEKDTAASEAAKVADLVQEVETVKSELAAAATARDEAVAERDTLKAEKETAARETGIDALTAELETIMPSADDAAKAALRETASKAFGDEGAINLMKANRTIDAHKAEIAALKAKTGVGTDTASDGPIIKKDAVSLAPRYETTTGAKGDDFKGQDLTSLV